jgi:hypothetical protein
MKIHLGAFRRRALGFGIKELVVVIACLTVLFLLAFLGVRALNERALRLQCQNNLREVGGALKAYCLANDGLLPDCTPNNPQFSGAAWPWDISTNLFNELVRRGATTNSLYCPANPAMNDLSHREFWRFEHNSLQVISYGMLFKGVGQEPAEYWRTNLVGDGLRSPAQTELGFDATVSMNNDFIHIRGSNVDRSNHVRGSRPLGGNVLFEDGHVAWRDFNQMQKRIQTWPPAFWYF